MREISSLSNPYSGLPKSAFWSSAVAQTSALNLKEMYKKKWSISADDKIATAGSCFAQHIARYLKAANYNVLDMEQAPNLLPEELHAKFGFSTYSARYGNIYTVRQFLQLAREVSGQLDTSSYVWEKNGAYFDAFRQNIEPDGLGSIEEVWAHRQFHLKRVKLMFEEMDVLVFTFGLTETWQEKSTGIVFPTAPGVIAGNYDSDRYSFKNFSYREIEDDFLKLQEILAGFRKGKKPLRYFITVSPVPLTATASGQHVLSASTYSKSVLRAVAGQLAQSQENVDYFPSFEIISNPASRAVFYKNNLRSVATEGVNVVMEAFFAEHQLIAGPQGEPVQATSQAPKESNFALVCEEELLEVFGRK